MLLHLVIAAALLAPGSGLTAAAGPTAAMVCSIAADLHATSPRTQGATDPALRRPTVLAPRPHSIHTHRLTTQLRR